MLDAFTQEMVHKDVALLARELEMERRITQLVSTNINSIHFLVLGSEETDGAMVLCFDIIASIKESFSSENMQLFVAIFTLVSHFR